MAKRQHRKLGEGPKKMSWINQGSEYFFEVTKSQHDDNGFIFLITKVRRQKTTEEEDVLMGFTCWIFCISRKGETNSRRY